MHRKFVSTSVLTTLLFMCGCSNDNDASLAPSADTSGTPTATSRNNSSTDPQATSDGGISYDEAEKNVKTAKNGTDLEITVTVQNVSSQDAIYDVVIVSGGKDVATESVSVVANSSDPANFYVPNYEKLLDVKNVSLALRTSEIAGDVDSISITDKI